MEFDLELEGDEALIYALSQSPIIVGQEMKKASDASLILLAGEMKDYPPAPADSWYIRTLTLGRTWSAQSPEWQAAGNGFFGSIANPTPYGPKVQSAQQQARVHRGRWDTDEDVLEYNYEKIKAQFEAGAKRVVNRLESGG